MNLAQEMREKATQVKNEQNIDTIYNYAVKEIKMHASLGETKINPLYLEHAMPYKNYGNTKETIKWRGENTTRNQVNKLIDVLNNEGFSVRRHRNVVGNEINDWLDIEW